MMIDKISSVNSINSLQSARLTSSVDRVRQGSDEIDVSDSAKKASEAYYLTQVANDTPDVRTELVEQIKQKIQDPNYLNDATIASAADKILSAFGL